MKSLLYEFMNVHKQKRVRESVMLARISASVFLIVACLAAMSFTAYAYFTCTVSSGITPLQSANFHADISIIAPDRSPIPLTPTGDGRFQAFLAGGNRYTVTLTATGTAETGFCVITSEISDKVYCTQQLGTDRAAPNGVRKGMTFYLTVEVSSYVTFFPHWGTSIYYEEYNSEKTNDQYIHHHGEVQITADRFPVQSPPPSEETTAPTEPSATPTTQPPETPSVTTPPQTESTVPPTTAPTVPEITPEETLTTEPIKSEPEETEPTQPESTESTQPVEITTPTTVPSSSDPTESN